MRRASKWLRVIPIMALIAHIRCRRSKHRYDEADVLYRTGRVHVDSRDGSASCLPPLLSEHAPSRGTYTLQCCISTNKSCRTRASAMVPTHQMITSSCFRLANGMTPARPTPAARKIRLSKLPSVLCARAEMRKIRCVRRGDKITVIALQKTGPQLVFNQWRGPITQCLDMKRKGLVRESTN